MLALTRKAGERIVINNNITVTIVEVKGDNVRLAIEAPKEIKIYRGEIYDAIATENQQAASPLATNTLDGLKDLQTKK